MHSLLTELTEKHYVSADDVLRMRREVFGDYLVDPQEAEGLFELADNAPNGDPEWTHFLSEALTDYFVRQKTPQGYITTDDARFLMDHFNAATPPNPLKTHALVYLIGQAKQVPQELILLAMDQIKAQILQDQKISEPTVRQIRQLLFAAGGDGNMGISRQEADYLFALNDATRHAENAACWPEFFAKTIANYLLAHSGYIPPQREEALRLEQLASGERPDPAAPQNVGTYVKLFSKILSETLKGNETEVMFRKQNENFRTGNSLAEQLTVEETAWLCQKIGANGRFDPAERALLQYVEFLKGDLPPDLAALVNN
ncbi:MAG: hypothetical protein ACWA5L_09240 [bacterium]